MIEIKIIIFALNVTVITHNDQKLLSKYCSTTWPILTRPQAMTAPLSHRQPGVGKPTPETDRLMSGKCQISVKH
jgi:hypothetical protein